MKILHYIWDFDGMLFDSYPRMTEAFVEAVARLGVSVAYDEAYPHVKRSLGTAIRRFAGGADRKALMDAYHEIEGAKPPETMVPFEGAAEFLKAVVDGGGRNYLYTHRDDAAWAALERHGMKAFFTGGVSADDGFPQKPAPDAILSIMKTHGVDPERAIMMGDRSIDIEAGHNAGIMGGLFDPEALAAPCEADYRFDTFEEMRRLLET